MRLPRRAARGRYLGERPELREQLFSAEFQAGWPEYVRHDPMAALYYVRALDRYLDFVLAAVDRESPTG